MSSLLAKFRAKRGPLTSDNQVPGEIVAMAKRVDTAVCALLTDKALATIHENGETTINADMAGSLEGLFIEDDAADVLAGVLDAADIGADHRGAATEAVLQTIDRYVTNGMNGGRLMATHNRSASNKDTNRSLVSVEDYLDPQIAAMFIGTEGFGIDTDKTAADLRLALDVALLKFHSSVATHMYQIRPTDEPAAVYRTSRAEILQLHDATADPVPFINLYADPTTVANELKDISPLVANVTDSEILADDILAFNKDANLLQLSIDATAPGYESINNTDLVADGVKIATIYVTFTVDESAPEAGDEFTERHALTVPIEKNTLTRLTNSADSADRALTTRFSAFLTSGALDSAGDASVILAEAADATEGVLVTCTLSSTINLKTGVIFTQCATTFDEYSTAGDDLSTEMQTMFDRISAIANYGYEVSAKFSEANFRKSDLAIRTATAQLAVAIPPGRKYVIESEIGQDADDRNSALLTNTIRIGEDSVVLSVIENTLDSIVTAVANDTNGIEDLEVFSRRYASGGRIKPYVITDTIDYSGITSVTDANRSGDIAARTIMFLTKVCADIAANSYITQQLNGQRPRYRAVTSNTVLDAIIGMPHIFQHLEAGAGGQSSGVEYTLSLPNGTKIEFVTTTFTSMADQIIMVPYIANAPESELNGGHLWDHGTVVTTYQHSTNHAAVDRTVGSARQLPLPTCPIGAVLSVSGITTATFTA